MSGHFIPPPACPDQLTIRISQQLLVVCLLVAEPRRYSGHLRRKPGAPAAGLMSRASLRLTLRSRVRHAASRGGPPEGGSVRRFGGEVRTMRDPDLVQRAERAAIALERAWGRWRVMHGLGTDPLPPVSSYVGYSLEEPYGQPRVVFGVGAEEAEKLAALLDGHDCVGPVHAEVTGRPNRRTARGDTPGTAGSPFDGVPAQASQPASAETRGPARPENSKTDRDLIGRNVRAGDGGPSGQAAGGSGPAAGAPAAGYGTSDYGTPGFGAAPAGRQSPAAMAPGTGGMTGMPTLAGLATGAPTARWPACARLKPDPRPLRPEERPARRLRPGAPAGGRQEGRGRKRVQSGDSGAGRPPAAGADRTSGGEFHACVERKLRR